jgi:two-component system, cell cycle sensor histidine kinase and response regulator CckA
VNGADLIQILLNLTINAFQSTIEPHSVKISTQLINQSIDFSQIKEGGSDRLLNPENLKGHPPLVLFMVEDSGPGISPENLSKIFQPFFSTKADKGTGLGLSIVQRLMKEARGVLHVHSELGKGTAFHLYLPAVGGIGSRVSH